MKIRKVQVAALLAGILWSLAGCGPNIGVAVGNTAPDFSVEGATDEKVVSLKSLEGKVVLLEFWATWCGPCRDVAPVIERLHRDHEKDGLKILSVSNEPRGTVEKFIKASPHSYPIFLDRDNSVNQMFGIMQIPYAVVIDRKGKVVYSGQPSGEMESKVVAALKG